jgi:hypothetical protein
MPLGGVDVQSHFHGFLIYYRQKAGSKQRKGIELKVLSVLFGAIRQI